jgi:hypothetical protein
MQFDLPVHRLRQGRRGQKTVHRQQYGGQRKHDDTQCGDRARRVDQQGQRRDDEGNQRQRGEEVQVQCAAMDAQQDDRMQQHGDPGQPQRQPVQRLAAAQQWAGEHACRSEIEHDGEQRKHVCGHSRAVSHRLWPACMRRHSPGPL